MSVLLHESCAQGDAVNGGLSNSILVTNEYATYNPSDPASVISPTWEANSGSFWSANGTIHNAKVPIDIGAPNAQSTNHNNNAVGRLYTKQSFSLGGLNQGLAVFTFITNLGLSVPSGTIDGSPNTSHDWDGIHIFGIYAAENSLYYGSINRRDGKVVIKRKKPGGPSNGGTYVDLSTYNNYTVPYGEGRRYRMEQLITSLSPLTVRIRLFVDSTKIAEAFDDGSVTGVTPLTSGRVGIRSDNCAWMADKFMVYTV